MPDTIAILDINFFEGQARTHWKFQPEILGDEPYVVANVPNNRIVSLNQSAKYCGLNRNMKLPEALSRVENLKVIEVPLDSQNRPIRKQLTMTSKAFYLCIQETRDRDFPYIKIEHGGQDEAYLDLTQEVDNFMAEDPRPYIHSNELHWNSYFQFEHQELLMSELQNFRQSKFFLSKYYPEVYHSARIISKFMNDLKQFANLQVSSGIGEDRFYAKLASELNDADSLTYLSREAFDRVSQNLDICKIVGLKRKIGDFLKYYFQICTVAELREIPFEKLDIGLDLIRESAKTREIWHKISGYLPYSYRDNYPIRDMVFPDSFKF